MSKKLELLLAAMLFTTASAIAAQTLTIHKIRKHRCISLTIIMYQQFQVIRL